ncbi:amino acid ABC transporter permease [Komagataeibacter xylinus]|uniref:Amino acid ABC transporter permease n=1 Tax=Komagataeibacter xylinus TaxID=28448 RepID=A0A857FN50_KOMXY|nr:amino acid ABC transporter permease [Komagataeibacter xylinus]QHC35595.1 amino acid ABC transporter permease [Komagataeibacter xylinus]
MFFDPEIVLRYSNDICRAFVLTLLLSVITIVIATPFALTIALVRRTSDNGIARLCIYYVAIFRSVPTLLTLYIIFFGLPTVGISLYPFTAAIIGLSLVSIAYLSEDLRGALMSVPDGQWQAMRALGFPFMHGIRRIILPQAYRYIFPTYMARLIIIVKSTSLASSVSVNELTGESYALISMTYHATEFLVTTSILYLLINLSLSVVQHFIEKRLK